MGVNHLEENVVTPEASLDVSHLTVVLLDILSKLTVDMLKTLWRSPRLLI